MRRRSARRLAGVAAACLLALPAQASADSGRIRFAGGTGAQQRQVRAALDASAFPFDLVPVTVTVHIGAGLRSQSLPGHVWLDGRLLDAGRFSWAIVQDEFAHQIDYFLLDDAERVLLNRLLGGRDWCYAVPGLPHWAYGCERFSSMVAWAFWPSRDNAYRPTSTRDESASMPPARFRAVVGALLGIPDPLGSR